RRPHTTFSRDWSSDVCSSDLKIVEKLEVVTILKKDLIISSKGNFSKRSHKIRQQSLLSSGTNKSVSESSNERVHASVGKKKSTQIGRASCRERVEISEDVGAC